MENKDRCNTCWKNFEPIDMCLYNGKPTCSKCSAKFIKYNFGKR